MIACSDHRRHIRALAVTDQSDAQGGIESGIVNVPAKVIPACTREVKPVASPSRFFVHESTPSAIEGHSFTHEQSSSAAVRYSFTHEDHSFSPDDAPFSREFSSRGGNDY